MYRTLNKTSLWPYLISIFDDPKLGPFKMEHLETHADRNEINYEENCEKVVDMSNDHHDLNAITSQPKPNPQPITLQPQPYTIRDLNLAQSLEKTTFKAKTSSNKTEKALLIKSYKEVASRTTPPLLLSRSSSFKSLSNNSLNSCSNFLKEDSTRTNWEESFPSEEATTTTTNILSSPEPSIWHWCGLGYLMGSQKQPSEL